MAASRFASLAWAFLKVALGSSSMTSSMNRYVSEFVGRQNIRRKDTIEQMVSLVGNMEKKKLCYRDLIAE